jgi:hypothetical protein
MTLRFSQVKTEYQLLVSVANCLWASKQNKFSKWKLGEWLGILVKKELGVLAKVTGPAYHSNDILWEDDLYPYRIPIKIIKYYEPGSRLNCISEFERQFEDAFVSIGFQIMTQNPFPEYMEKKWLENIMTVQGSPLKKETIIRDLQMEEKKLREIEKK